MKPFLHKIMIIFLGLMTFACSHNIAKVESDEIAVRISDGNLTIYNLLQEPIYYFAVEKGISALIYWVPISSEENKINPGQKTKIDLDDISGHKSSKEIIIFYWTGTDFDSIYMRSIQIDT